MVVLTIATEKVIPSARMCREREGLLEVRKNFRSVGNCLGGMPRVAGTLGRIWKAFFEHGTSRPPGGDIHPLEVFPIPN